MAVKFSQFNAGATVADIDFIVGYKSTDNIQIPIGLVTVNTTYSIATAQDGLNESLTLTGVGPASTDVITFTAGANITLTDDGAGNGFTIQAKGSVDGTGTANVLSKWSDSDTLTDSILTETAAAGQFTDPYISVGGAGGGVSTQNLEINGFLLDSNGQKGSAGQLLSSTGTVTDWVTPTDADTTYTVATAQSGLNETLTLTGSDASTDVITFTAGNDITLTDDGAGNGFTIASTASGDTYTIGSSTNGSSVNVNLDAATGADSNITLTPVGGIAITQTGNVITLDTSSVGTISGAGTTGKVPLWTGATALGDSVITQIANGNVGINVTDPDAQLEIVNSLGGSYRLGYSGTDAYFDAENLYVRSGNGNTNKFIIDSSGDVGIGTTSVASGGTNTQNVQIHNSTANSTYLKLSTAGTGAGAGDGLDLVLGNNGEAYLWNRENASTIFATNNTVKMTITAAGGISFGATGTAYGTSGQVLQSNGNLPPTWVAAPASLPTKTVDTATIANATTGTFTLTVTPSSENYVDMYISGVYQSKTTYTVAGTTVTLDGGTFFPNGAVVETVTTT